MRHYKIYKVIVAKIVILSVCMSLILACTLNKAQIAFNQGNYDEALIEYRKLLISNPKNRRALKSIQQIIPIAVEKHLTKAHEAHKLGRIKDEMKEVGMALLINPGNSTASEWLTKLEKSEIRQQLENNVDLEQLKAQVKSDYITNQLNHKLLEAIDISFARRTELKEVMRQLSNYSGINIILHNSISDDDFTISAIDLHGLNLYQVLDTLMLQNELFYRVIDHNSIMVYKRTKETKIYESNLLQAFYLTNAEANKIKQTLALLLPELRTISSDDITNSIVIEGKANDIALASCIIKQLDKAKAEVMIYLELLEITGSDLYHAGLMPVNTISGTNITADPMYSAYAAFDFSGNLLTSNIKAPLSQTLLRPINYLLPGLRLDFAKSTGEAKVLAKPNIRVVSKTKGQIKIGDKISVIDKVFQYDTSKNTVESSYRYEEIGIDIIVTPTVHINNDITIELIAKITTSQASNIKDRHDLGTREITTQVRLQDGDQVVFAGLLREDEKDSLKHILGLSDIPVIGQLFRAKGKEKRKTDVVLSMRADILRKSNLKEEDFNLVNISDLGKIKTTVNDVVKSN